MDAASFHESTKHTPLSVRRGGGGLDWSNQPHPFKDYLDLAPLPLPPPARDTGHAAVQAIVERAAPVGRRLDVRELARLLLLSAGVIRTRAYPDGQRVHFRTYASAGALYPIEVYVACAGIDGLDAGLYHFHPLEKALRLLRAGDPRPYLLRATGERSSVGSAPISLVLSGIPWRTTWKYGARGYRHLYWDSGMILANVLALAASGNWRAEVLLGFVDRDLDALIGVDGRTEMALAIAPVGTSEAESEPAPAGEPAEPLEARVRPLSRRPREHSEVVDVHRATALVSPEQAASWGETKGPPEDRPPADPARRDGIEQVIRRRGSARAFRREPIQGSELAEVVAGAQQPVSSDWGGGLLQLAAIVNAADGYAPGAYAWGEDGLDQLARGDFREAAYFLCLDQALGGDAAATCFLLSELARVFEALGPRGYRAAQLNAGISAGRAVLGAYAYGLGATGLTFYDDEVRRFFGTSAEPMLVVALGRPARRRRLL